MVLPPFLKSLEEQHWFDVFVSYWFAEDLRHGDLTSESIFLPDQRARAVIVAREAGRLCGRSVVEYIWRRYVPEGQCQGLLADGEFFRYGSRLITLEGPTIQLLMFERPLLNLLQHLSAITTQSAQWSEKVRPYGTRLLATRKTTPGLRWLEKWAVELGGVLPHRRDLSEEVMIKDNHADATGSLSEAVRKVVERLKQRGMERPIVVEVRSINDIEQIRPWWERIDRILLDNFTPEEVKTAVDTYGDVLTFEASGGIHEANLLDYAQTGVPYLSSSAVHRPQRPLDLSMRIEFE